MKHRGFTLIELLAVLIVLGVLALIAVPAVTSLIADSREKTFKNSINGMLQAIEMYSTKIAGDNISIDLNPTGSDISKIDYNGKDPELGIAYIAEDGMISIFMCDPNYCGYRRRNEKIVTVQSRKESEDIASKNKEDLIQWLND